MVDINNVIQTLDWTRQDNLPPHIQTGARSCSRTIGGKEKKILNQDHLSWGQRLGHKKTGSYLWPPSMGPPTHAQAHMLTPLPPTHSNLLPTPLQLPLPSLSPCTGLARLVSSFQDRLGLGTRRHLSLCPPKWRKPALRCIYNTQRPAQATCMGLEHPLVCSLTEPHHLSCYNFLFLFFNLKTFF